jgi:threonine dehydrogenase-like Zn-dependent dehydrogenase
MGSTYDDEHTQGGATFSPYCHGPAYYYSPQVELVAGADPHDEQRELFGERWGISPDHLYRSHKDMKDTAQMLLDGRIRVGPLIAHRLPWQQTPDAYHMLFNSPEEALGVILEWDR